MAVSFRADSACRLVSYFKALIELVYQKLRLPNQREVPDTENAAEPAVTASQRTLAWKHVGYPGFCKLMGSSDELLALRFFKNVNVRVLLRLQNDIVRLERALKQQDDYTKGLPIDQGSCASLRLDAGSPREETLTQLQHRLKDYNERLNTFLQLCDRPGAPAAVQQNLKQWLQRYPNAIETPEQEFLDHKEDLIGGNIEQQSRFERWLIDHGAWRAATLADSQPQSGPCYYDDAKWRRIGEISGVCTTLVILLGSVWGFHSVKSMQSKLAVLSFSTVGFRIVVDATTTLGAMHKCYAVAWFIMFETLTIGTIHE